MEKVLDQLENDKQILANFILDQCNLYEKMQTEIETNQTYVINAKTLLTQKFEQMNIEKASLAIKQSCFLQISQQQQHFVNQIQYSDIMQKIITTDQSLQDIVLKISDQRDQLFKLQKQLSEVKTSLSSIKQQQQVSNTAYEQFCQEIDDQVSIITKLADGNEQAFVNYKKSLALLKEQQIDIKIANQSYPVLGFNALQSIDFKMQETNEINFIKFIESKNVSLQNQFIDYNSKMIFHWFQWQQYLTFCISVLKTKRQINQTLSQLLRSNPIEDDSKIIKEIILARHSLLLMTHISKQTPTFKQSLGIEQAFNLGTNTQITVVNQYLALKDSAPPQKTVFKEGSVPLDSVESLTTDQTCQLVIKQCQFFGIKHFSSEKYVEVVKQIVDENVRQMECPFRFELQQLPNGEEKQNQISKLNNLIESQNNQLNELKNQLNTQYSDVCYKQMAQQTFNKIINELEQQIKKQTAEQADVHFIESGDVLKQFERMNGEDQQKRLLQLNNMFDELKLQDKEEKQEEEEEEENEDEFCVDLGVEAFKQILLVQQNEK